MKETQGVYVEARKLYELSQNLDVRKTPIHPRANYSSNPLVPLLAGFLFEQQGDENAALIQYESALKAFENSNCELNYGVSLPKQLPQDIVRICKSLGFEEKVTLYSKKYGITLKKGEERQQTAIVLTEVGITPYKQLHRVYITPNGVMHYRTPIPTPVQGKSVQQIVNYDDRNWQTLPAELHYSRVMLETDQKEFLDKETNKNYPLIGKGKCKLVFIPAKF